MCGICGFVRTGGMPLGSAEKIGIAMAQRIAQRGPDAVGCWADAEAGVVLAHRRLAIVELSEAGGQPMVSASGRYQFVFNGEIYNHSALRRQLTDQFPELTWRGGSDTETLLASIEHLGIATTLERTVGMFAFALWDRRDKVLHLARDRMGEKPLYFGRMGKTFFFASDLAALHAHPDFDPVISDRAVSRFLKYSYVPAELTIYEGFSKLKPGTWMTVDCNNAADGAGDTQISYWELEKAVGKGLSDPLTGDASSCADSLETALLDSIRGQLMSDVPIGAFLSGGVDSSAVVALMQTISPTPVRTFSIGFADAAYDEAVHADKIARHLNTQHNCLILEPSDVVDVIPQMSEFYSEPFADSSQVPTYLVSRFARDQVTVALTGDGGDELFGGYNRYIGAMAIWRAAQRLPDHLRRLVSRLIRSRTTTEWDRMFAAVGGLTGGSRSIRMPGVKMHKVAEVLHADRIQDLYSSVAATGRNVADLFDRYEDYAVGDRMLAWLLESEGEVQAMMALDAVSYMPDDVLVKVDRASMACGLEARAPFLDHRVVELSWRMPLNRKIDKGLGKKVLRDVLYRHVPRELIERPKMGFGIPIGDWLRTELREWAESLLSEEAIANAGFLNAAAVRRQWTLHLEGRSNNETLIWNILMFQAWHRRWAKG